MLTSIEKRDEAIARVAEGVGPDWLDQAYQVMVEYARSHHHFLTEDVRQWSYENGLRRPHDNRAWGPVTMRAVKNGIVVKDGFELTKNSGNARHQLNWKSLICGAPKPITIDDLFD